MEEQKTTIVLEDDFDEDEDSWLYRSYIRRFGDILLYIISPIHPLLRYFPTIYGNDSVWMYVCMYV